MLRDQIELPRLQLAEPRRLMKTRLYLPKRLGTATHVDCGNRQPGDIARPQLQRLAGVGPDRGFDKLPNLGCSESLGEELRRTLEATYSIQQV